MTSNSTSTYRIHWSVLVLIPVLAFAAYWFISHSNFSDHEDLHIEELRWWGQYMPISASGNGALEQESSSLIEVLALRKANFESVLDDLPSQIRREKDLQKQATLETLAWYLDLQLRGEPFLYHSFPMNPFEGITPTLTTNLELRYPITSTEDAEIYVGQLPLYAEQLLALIPWMEKKDSLSLLPSVSVLERSIAQMDQFLAYSPEEHPIYRAFARSLIQLASTEINEYKATDLLIQLAKGLEEEIYPAIRKLKSQAQDLQAAAPQHGGVGHFPQGALYYDYCLNYYVGTEADPGLIEQIAEREVNAIGQILEQLEETPREEEKINEDSLFQIRMKLIESTIRELRSKSKGIISTIPRRGPVVRPMPEVWAAQGETVAYLPAQRLRSKKSAVFLNGMNSGGYSEASAVVWAYASAIPGQHIASSMLSDSDVRHKFEVPAWQEGWAWYAASVPVTDLRLLANRPEVYMGYLMIRRQQAALALVDVRLHTLVWKEEEAKQFLIEAIGMSASDASLEVDRCIALPAKACAPLMGAKKIQDIRENILEELDNNISLKELHDWILGIGPVPFELLDRYTLEFIRSKLAS